MVRTPKPKPKPVAFLRTVPRRPAAGYFVSAEMSGGRYDPRSGLGDVMRQFVATLTASAICALCGRGHASTGWLVDPFGRVSGRCAGCAGDARTARPRNPGPGQAFDR